MLYILPRMTSCAGLSSLFLLSQFKNFYVLYSLSNILQSSFGSQESLCQSASFSHPNQSLNLRPPSPSPLLSPRQSTAKVQRKLIKLIRCNFSIYDTRPDSFSSSAAIMYFIFYDGRCLDFFSCFPKILTLISVLCAVLKY